SLLAFWRGRLRAAESKVCVDGARFWCWQRWSWEDRLRVHFMVSTVTAYPSPPNHWPRGFRRLLRLTACESAPQRPQPWHGSTSTHPTTPWLPPTGTASLGESDQAVRR